MANKNLFKSATSVPAAKARNKAGGKAYKLSSKQALAQYACTGTFTNTYYTTAKEQLDRIVELSAEVEPEFLAKLAVYARHRAYMKDTPALLVAILATKDVGLFRETFPKVIDNGKMLRNFVQIVRSGVTGRKSLGTAPKKMVEAWLTSASDEAIFKASVGTSPSLADVIKLVHPAPETPARNSLYGYVISKAHDKKTLPQLVKDYEKFKASAPGSREVPDVPFQMLDSLGLSDEEWVTIARNAKWQMTRMNLNTFARHNVFKAAGMTTLVAKRLADHDEVRRSRNFPYQIMQAMENVDSTVPASVRMALGRALEHSVSNVPPMEGKIYVAVDCSGSMSMPVSGSKGISCNRAGSLFAAAIVRNNPTATVYRFDTKAEKVKLSKTDTLEEAARKISQAGGGTDCSCVLRELNAKNAKGDLVVIVSDNESWADRGYYRQTGLMAEWTKFRARNPNAKLVCIDMAVGETTQAPNRPAEVLNVGGFSDEVFNVISRFLTHDGSESFWTDAIENSK